MAIEVELPDGTVVEFPDGTPPDVMKAAMAKRFPAPGANAKPSLFRMDSDFKDKAGLGTGDMLGAAARDMFGSRESAATYLAEKVNQGQGIRGLMAQGAKVLQDDKGEPILALPDGTQYRLNDPGLDNADLANVAGNIAAYMPAAKLAGLGMNALARIGIGAAASGATDAGLQAAFKGEGEAYDPMRTAVAAAGGAAGEVVAPIAGKVMKALTRSPAKGEQRAAEILRRDLGVPQPTRAQVQAMVRGLDEIDAGADPAAVLGSDEFGFLYTRGQRLAEGKGKFQALTREEALAQDQGMAGDIMRSIKQRNRETLDRVVGQQVDRVGGAKPPLSPVDAFERIGERVSGQADELSGKVSKAYDRAAESGRTAVSADAVRGVPARLQAALREFPSDPRLTPATRAMLDDISAKAAALGPDVKGVTLRAIEDQRKVIGNAFGAAANPTDRAALRVLKTEYDRWLDDAFDQALVTGDEQALAAMKEARGLRAEFGRRFEGSGADTDKFIQQMLAGERTPDELVNVALGASQVSKAGAARFVERLKAATGNDPEVMGALKAAHLMRLLQNKQGETLGVQAIRSNILAAEQNTPSVLRSLYSPEEWAQVKRLAVALEPLSPKGDFARSSGTWERAMRQMRALPFIGRAVDMVQKPVRVGQASGATGRLARTPAPRPIAAAGAAAGVESDRP